MATQTVLAVDLGAESGRVMAVRYDGKTLHMDELRRFATASAQVRSTLHWDALDIWRNVEAGIAKGAGLNPASIGVDTWGVDFALLDARDALIGNPVHYRDGRTAGMMERVFARVERSAVFERTGIQFMPINTIYQLMSMVAAESPQLQIARTFLTIPDLLNYWLTGVKVCEWTNATTTQLADPRTGAWAADLIDAIGVSPAIFPPLVRPGTRLGDFAGIPVIAPATHDTGSSVAAVPLLKPRSAYISSGTWSLVGLEIGAPLINPAALAANVTNEGGVDGTTRLLKNVMGLWIVQQCRAAWAAYDYAELMRLAAAAPPLGALIDPNDERFLPPGDHPRLIRAICAERGEPPPDGPGAIVRCVLESLALAYDAVLTSLDELVGARSEVIHVVGGGARNTLLCQLTANATGRPVLAGPVESTVLGNALVQLIALGELANLAEARQLIAGMDGGAAYEPQDPALWAAARQRYRELAR